VAGRFHKLRHPNRIHRFSNFAMTLEGTGCVMTFNLIKSQQAAIVQDGLFSFPTPIYSCATVQQLNSCNSWKPYQYSFMRVIRRRKNGTSQTSFWKLQAGTKGTKL